jgi:hypothetical protein
MIKVTMHKPDEDDDDTLSDCPNRPSCSDGHEEANKADSNITHPS